MPRIDFIALYLFLNGPTRRVELKKAYKKCFNAASTSVYLFPQQVSEMGLWEKDLSKSETSIKTEQYYVEWNNTWVTLTHKTCTKSVWRLTERGKKFAISILNKELQDYIMQPKRRVL